MSKGIKGRISNIEQRIACAEYVESAYVDSVLIEDLRPLIADAEVLAKVRVLVKSVSKVSREWRESQGDEVWKAICSLVEGR